MKKAIAIWWWKVRYAVIFMRRCSCGWSLAWQCAEASADAGNHEDMTPSDAVDEELSYWAD